MDRRPSPRVDNRMQTEWSLAATRGAYVARQLPRLLWYVGHGYVMGRLAERARSQNGRTERRHNGTKAAVPDRGRLYRDMAALFRTDLANVEAGVYPLPRDRDGSLLTLLDRSGLFFDVTLSRILHHPAPGLEVEILEVVAGPTPASFFVEHFGVLTGLPTTM